jgi:hypothetical protein
MGRNSNQKTLCRWLLYLNTHKNKKDPLNLPLISVEIPREGCI